MEIGKYFEHTNLKKDAVASDIEKLCHEAIKYGLESVCVNPCYVPLAKSLLDGSNINVSTVINFPYGASTPKTKSFEAVTVMEMKVDEVGIAINIGALKDHDYDYVKSEIEEVRDVIDGQTLKVMVDMSLLTDEEIIKIVEICNETFVNFILIYGDISFEIIEMVNKYRNDILEIQVLGDIKSFDMINEFINYGVSRIGIKNIDILKEVK